MIDKKRKVYTIKKQEKRQERTMKTHYLLSLDSPFNAPQRRVFHDNRYLSNLFLQILFFQKRKNIKAYVRYFLSSFYFSPSGSPSKAMKKCFLFHLKSSFCSRGIQIFVFPSSHFFSPFQPLL